MFEKVFTKSQVLTIPNLLSLVRLILIPCIVITYFRQQYTASLILIAISIAAILFALKSSDFMSRSSKIYTADYAVKLEKDLASVDYTGDMDKIAEAISIVVREGEAGVEKARVIVDELTKKYPLI